MDFSDIQPKSERGKRLMQQRLAREAESEGRFNDDPQMQELSALQEKVNDNAGRKGTGSLAFGPGTSEPIGKNASRSKAGGSTKPRDDEGSSWDYPSTSRSNGKSLGNGRKKSSSYSPYGRSDTGTSGGGKEVDRPASGQAPTLLDWALNAIKRAFAYVGFDVSGDADSLTDTEISELLPSTISFVQKVGMSLDYGLTHSNKFRQESDIWMFEDDEAEKVAHWWLKRAKKVRWMAQVSRQVPHMDAVGESAAVAKIIGERMIASAIFIPNNGGLGFWMK